MKTKTYLLLPIICCLCWQCVDPVEPVFRFRDNFLVVDGRLGNIPGGSYLNLSLAQRSFSQFILEPVEAQSVSTISESGEETIWEYDTLRTTYFPPEDYAGQVGESYFLRLVDEDGTVYESRPELMLPVVALEDFSVRFNQESYFSTELEQFVPAFELFAAYNDPVDADNFYRFSYRSWEKIIVCVSCFFGQYVRDVGCVSTNQARIVPRFDYLCEEDCWELSRYADAGLVTDEFNNGNTITDFQVGQIDYDWFGPILVIGELESISPDAHEFYRVLQAQSTTSGNLNATLPTSLDGNIDPVVEGEGAILGYFSTSSISEERIYFNRDTTMGDPLRFDGTINLDIPPPPGEQYFHPCFGSNRSTQRPVGWPE